jgi:hypothetical protein
LTRDPVFLGHITLHSPETKPTKLHTVSSRPASRDPVPRGGKVRLPQRPEVSSKQATPLPLPNRLRQPLYYPREPQASHPASKPHHSRQIHLIQSV